eukprot:192647-Prorocentrum_minimum.AAC.1
MSVDEDLFNLLLLRCAASGATNLVKRRILKGLVGRAQDDAEHDGVRRGDEEQNHQEGRHAGAAHIM